MSTYVYVDEAAGGFQPQGGQQAGGPARKPVQRRTVDYTATTVRHLEMRVYQKDPWDNAMLQPTPGAMLDVSVYAQHCAPMDPPPSLVIFLSRIHLLSLILDGSDTLFHSQRRLLLKWAVLWMCALNLTIKNPRHARAVSAAGGLPAHACDELRDQVRPRQHEQDPHRRQRGSLHARRPPPPHGSYETAPRRVYCYCPSNKGARTYRKSPCFHWRENLTHDPHHRPTRFYYRFCSARRTASSRCGTGCHSTSRRSCRYKGGCKLDPGN